MTVAQGMRAGLLATAAVMAAASLSSAVAAVSAPSPAGKTVELAHMERGHEPDRRGHPGRYEGHGYGERMMRYHMMPHGMMDPRSMGPDMRGRGMMGPEMMAPGVMGRGRVGHGMTVLPNLDLSVDDVRHFLQHQLAWEGNKRLKVGVTKESDEDTIVADIVTKEGVLVDRFEIDRHTGDMKRID